MCRSATHVAPSLSHRRAFAPSALMASYRCVHAVHDNGVEGGGDDDDGGGDGDGDDDDDDADDDTDDDTNDDTDDATDDSGRVNLYTV